MQSYDGVLFDPPAPLARVTLRDPATGTTVMGIPMLLDSGADVTLLPQSGVQRLGVASESAGEIELVGFDGRRSTAPIVRVDLVLLGKTFKG
ncbi:MAG TPA: aspartyl protease family protein, partial [Thermoanaerobaculia bacterium]|nr:aspartyl protease family protein [Thermoanaerobaculia bacterium]